MSRFNWTFKLLIYLNWELALNMEQSVCKLWAVLSILRRGKVLVRVGNSARKKKKKEKKPRLDKIPQKTVRKWVMKLNWMCMTAHWVSLCGIKHSLSRSFHSVLLPPIFFPSLCNYSCYGISNTSDIFQCQRDQNQSWETVFFMYSFNSSEGVRPQKMSASSLPYAEHLRTWSLEEEDHCIFLSVFSSTA